LAERFAVADGVGAARILARERFVAIRLDQVDVQHEPGSRRETLEFAEAEAEGWFNGPPYAVLEHVFDEDDIVDCSVAPDSGIPIKRTGAV
jgi:hypothetical protein